MGISQQVFYKEVRSWNNIFLKQFSIACGIDIEHTTSYSQWLWRKQANKWTISWGLLKSSGLKGCVGISQGEHLLEAP